MEAKVIVDNTIPLWGIITILGSFGLTIGWNIVKLYFSDKTRERDMELVHTKILDIENELDKHRVESDKKIDEVKSSITTMNNNLIEVKTLVKLLVGDRIKKPDDESKH